MDLVTPALQLVIAIGIVNVWILRFNRSSTWRGGDARTMTEEFAVYGLSERFMRLVGALKLTFAALLVIGIWQSTLTPWAALGMATLMVGALAMHLKVGDPVMRSVPALSLFAMSVIVLATSV